MATRKLEIEIIGDSKSVERAFARTQKAAEKFGRTTDTMGGRLDATAKKFGNLQTAFVGGIAFGAAATGIRSVVTAAAESQQVLGQTKVALEAVGKSWGRYGQQIETVIKKQSRLGFDDEALMRTFSLFVRTTGDVNQALRLNALATDVSRGRYIDLEQAAQLVNKAAIGQSGALRRLGISVSSTATAQELLTALTEKYGGAAQAAGKDASTAFQRAQVEIENAKETIGGNLLPTVAGLATTLSDTLVLFQKIGAVKIPPIHVPLVFDFGGGTIGKLVHQGIFTLPEFVNLTKDIVTNLINDFRTATKVSTPELAHEFTLSLNTMFQSALDTAAANMKTPTAKLTPAIEFDKLPGVDTGTPIAESFGASVDKFIKVAQAQAADAIRKGRAAITKEAQAASREKQRGAFNDLIAALGLKVDQAAATKGIADDLRANTVLQNAIKKQIGVEGKTTELASQLFQARQARAALLGQQATAAAAASEKAAEKIQAAQFRALGLDESGNKPPPTIENLRKQLRQLSSRNDLASSQRGLLKRIRKVLVDPIHKATPETRDAIRQMYETIRSEFDQGSKKLEGPLTKTTSLNTKAALANVTGLNRDQIKQIRANLSSFNSAGVALAGSQTVAAVNVNLTNITNVGGETVAKNVTKHQQKAARRNPPQKRGPNRRGGV